MTGLEIVGSVLGAVAELLRPAAATPPVVVVVRPDRHACVAALPAADGGDAPGLDDDDPEVLAADPDLPVERMRHIPDEGLWHLLVRAARHTANGETPEGAAHTVMAELELEQTEAT